MRWLITGAGGMLGHDLRAALADRELTALTRSELDITDETAVCDAVANHDVVVNTAAWTAVDDAETNEAEAFGANAVGPATLARACRKTRATLVHISTDYVFSGMSSEPYVEDALIAPQSAYGRTKAAGEWAVRSELPDHSFVVRTAWLYGAHGPNFVATVLRLARERDVLTIVNDQVGQPTWTRDVAERLVLMAEAGVPAGVYHATNAGRTSWYGLARRVLELAGDDPERVRPATTDMFPRPAKRPAWSVLGHGRWATAKLAPLRSWEEALEPGLASILAEQRMVSGGESW